MLARLSEIKNDLLAPSVVLPSLAQGLIICIMTVIVESSFANLVFSGPLGRFAIPATGLFAFAAFAMTLVTGLASPFKGVVTISQDIPAAILAGMGAAVAGAMVAAPARPQFATMVALVMLSGLGTAVLFWLMGRFRLSNLIRFLPFPVVAGFLGGCGFLLCLGGLGVMTGVSPSLATMPDYFQGQVLFKWLCGVGFGVILYMVLNRIPHALVMPAALLLCIAGFFAAFAIMGMDVESARQQGWLVEALPGGRLWPAVGMDDFALVDWGVVVGQLPSLLAVALLSCIALLLNLGGMELATGSDIDMDRELYSGAVANLFGALSGGCAGYASMSLSLLSHRTGLATRLVPIFGALFTLGVVLFGADVLTFFPKPVLGGLLFLLGLFFFNDWVFSGWRKLAVPDFAIVLSIVGAIAWFGFLEGVGLGLLLSIFIFIFRFSRVPVIRRELTGADVRSRVERHVPARVLLDRHAGDIRIIELGGYVFFGSACFLAQRVAELLGGEERPRHLILSLAGIDGFDVSAVNNFLRIAQQAANRDVRLVFCRVPDALWDQMQRNSTPETMAGIGRFAELDLALEEAESEIIERASSARNDAAGRGELLDQAFDELDGQLEGLERFEALLGELGDQARQISIAAGQTILAEGDALDGAYLVVWGTVGEYMRRNGREIRLRHTGRGSVLTPQGILAGRKARITARAEEDCVLALVSRQALEVLSRENPALAIQVQELLLERATQCY